MYLRDDFYNVSSITTLHQVCTKSLGVNSPLVKAVIEKILYEVRNKGAVIFNVEYRGGRIFGGVPNLLASFYWGIKYFGKNCEMSDGL